MADPLEGVSPAGTIVTGASRARVAAEYESALELADRLSHGHEHLCRAVEIAPMTNLDGESDES